MTTLPNFTPRTFGTFIAVVCLSATSLSAQTIISGDIQRSDLSGNVNYSGAGVVGTTGDTWNNINKGGGSATFSSLLSSTGAATGVSFTMFTANAPEANSETNGVASKPYPNAFNGIYKEYAYNSTATGYAFSFSGLSPGLTYNLYLLGAARVGGVNYAGSWVVNGTRKTTAPVSSADTTFLNSPTLTEGAQYVSFSGLSATETAPSSGIYQITGTFGLTSGVAVWQGFQLVAVPEPSSFAALAGLGALGFAASRRRRR